MHCFLPIQWTTTFKSPPFTPPEVDDGEFTFSRDVFGFGTIVLACLTDVRLTDYPDIKKALARFDAPPKVREEIARAVDFNPVERPATADVLLAELRRIQKKRARKSTRKRCNLCFLPKGIKELQTVLQVESYEEVMRLLREDLNQECGVRPYKGSATEYNSENAEGHYSLFGPCYRYHVKVGDPAHHLFVFGAWQTSSAALERQRDQSWRAPYEFFIDMSQGQAESSDSISELEMAVSEYEAKAKAERAEAEEQRVFRVWNDLIDAKAEGEKQKETLLPYQSAEVRGQYVVFWLAGQLPDSLCDIVGESWRVKLPGTSALGGVVADLVDGDRLHLQVKYGDPVKLPRQGVLTFDITSAQTNLKRERIALDAVRFDRAARHDLGRLLTHPETARQPIPYPNIEFRQDLDEAKQNAVRSALGSEDCLAVEGPPGTGKTRLIAEVVLQYLKKRPTSRVLVTSQTHVALDNAIERIAALDPALNIVRVARPGDPRVSPAVEPLMLENQLQKWTVEVIGRGKQFLTSWATQHGVRQDEVEVSAVLRRLSFVLEQIEAAESEVARLREADGLDEVESVGQMLAREEELSRLTIALASRRKDRKGVQNELRDRGFEDLAGLSRPEIDESANALLGESAEATRFLALLKIHAAWVEGFGKGPEFHAALLARTQVVSGTCLGLAGVHGWDDLEFDLCILDEASKATPTEALVPMSRSRSWVVVGDPQQLPPFQHEFLRDRDVLQDYNLTPGDLKETILNRFLAHLPKENRLYLNEQHRMIGPIGNLISHCFYPERGLLSPRTDCASALALVPVLPRPVTWFTTARLPNRQEQKAGTSYINRSEVDAVRQILGHLNAALSQSERKYRVAVLTGYAEQRRTIERAIRPELGSWGALSVECNTVHAIQGREAQIAIYSVTRSNDSGKIGHLRETELLNVALSRAEFGLVIVGDHHFCRSVLCDNPLGRVLEYVECHPEDCALVEVSG